ncbi:hypothetical protein [Trinickia acidisoli]|uniref:hypothetical protein n=1 Tax=Trinickia acidisoli TaxID=2767482 RepID=UPI001A90901E|nr:hypothetical protein [Trinickia acidisoli]
MGTLAGYSSNLRQELVFNAMNITAIKQGCVRLKNPDACRTILFLPDLWMLIEQLLRKEHEPGFYNVGSISLTIGELASRVASVWDVPVIYEGTSETYSFTLDCGKMQAVCGENKASISLEERCRDFIFSYNSKEAT